MSALIEFRNVSKHFGDEPALRGVSFEIHRGDFTAVIGPSGCGKSTILRLIVALEEPDFGEIRFEGQRLTTRSIAALRRRIGYVIQDGGLFPHLTARGNIALAARAKRDGAFENRLHELCELTRFPPSALARYPLELSGGQRQRVSLMRALVLSPELLLLDEPFAALDPLVRLDLQRDLKTICQQLQQTVLFVTHDLAEAARLATRLILMKDGAIVQSGTFAELDRAPASNFVSDFINAQRPAALS